MFHSLKSRRQPMKPVSCMLGLNKIREIGILLINRLMISLVRIRAVQLGLKMLAQLSLI